MQTFSFCHVEDLVDGFLRLMEPDEDVIAPVNLGNPSEFTIRQLAEMVVAMTGSSSEIVYRDLPQDDPKQRQPYIALAKEKLGLQPSVPIEPASDRQSHTSGTFCRRSADHIERGAGR